MDIPWTLPDRAVVPLIPAAESEALRVVVSFPTAIGIRAALLHTRSFSYSAAGGVSGIRTRSGWAFRSAAGRCSSCEQLS
jgi:hypothetical protein